MLTIPEVRQRLADIASRCTDPSAKRSIRLLLVHMRRRPAAKRADVTSQPMTPDLADAIRRYARRYPSASQLQIAVHYGVNQGRVSEALRGKRGK